MTFSSNVSSNTLMIFWMVFSLVILIAYECNLRANIIATDYEKPIDSEDDLVTQNKRLHFYAGTRFTELLKDSSMKNRQLLGQMADKQDLVFNVDQKGLIEIGYEKPQILETGKYFSYNLCQSVE